MTTIAIHSTRTEPVYATAPPKKTEQEIGRILTAAVINKGFRNLLLNNPAEAIANGYNGESFYLASDAQELIFSIQAVSLADFALQLAKHQNTKMINGNNNASWANNQDYQRA